MHLITDAPGTKYSAYGSVTTRSASGIQVSISRCFATPIAVLSDAGIFLSLMLVCARRTLPDYPDSATEDKEFGILARDRRGAGDETK